MLVNFGGSVLAMEGNTALIRGFARDLLKAIDGDKAVVFDAVPEAQPLEEGKTISVDRQKYQQIRAEVEAPNFTGIISDVCTRYGVKAERFFSWCAYRRRLEARKQPAA